MDITSEEFGVFFRGSGSRRASVIVNLTIGDSAPLVHLPTLLRITIAMPVYRNSGTSIPGENGSYAGLEFELVSQLSKQVGATFVARELTVGQMKFYFYAPLGVAVDPIVTDVLKSYPTFKYLLSRISDPEWTIYFDELYPSGVEFQLMTNHERHASAVELGDCLEEPRSICHWAYFPTPEARETFLERVLPRDFKIHLLDQHELDTVERRFCVELARYDRADHPYLDELVLWLDHQADECGGEYDGFEEESITARLPNLIFTGR